MRAAIGLIWLISGAGVLGVQACAGARPLPPAPEGPVVPVLGTGEAMFMGDGGVLAETDSGPDGGASAAEPSGAPIAVLVKNVHASTAFAVDDNAIYWIDEALGEVSRAPKRGGLTMTLYSSGDRPFGSGSSLAVEGGDVYWIADLGNGQSSLMRLEKNGGKPALIASSTTSRLTGLALDGQSVYWVAGNSVLRAPKAGGPGVALLAGQAGADGVAVDDQNAYVSSAGTEAKQYADGSIVVVSKKGGASRVLVAGAAHAANVEVDETNAYWLSGSSVMFVPKAGGAATVLVNATGPIDDFALDGGYVYFASHTSVADGSIARVPKEGGPSEPLVSGQPPAAAIAVDQTAVYWSSIGTEAKKYVDGAVSKRDKP